MLTKNKKLISLVLCIAMLSSLAIFSIPASAAGPLTLKDGFLEIEAEKLPYNKDNLEVRSGSEFSGKSGLGVTNEDKTIPATGTKPDIDLTFVAEKAGTYTIWSYQSCAGDMSAQTAFFSIGTGGYSTVTLAGSPGVCAWTKMGSITVANDGETVAAGLVRRQMWSTVFDKFVITSNIDYNPASGMAPDGTAKPIETPKPSIKTANGFLMVEAETLPYNKSNIEVSSGSGMSGGKGLGVTSEDKTVPPANSAPDIDISFMADKPGTYTIWARQASAGDESGRTAFFSVGAGAYNAITLGGSPGEFVWTKLGTVPASASGDVVMARLIRRQQWSIVFDKFIITDNKTYTPTGMGQEPKAPSLADAEKLPSNVYKKPSVTPIASHPRVMFTKEDIPTIKANFTNEQNASAYSELERLLGNDFDGILPAAKAGSSNYSAPMLAIIEAYAFDYAVNGNTANGERAISAILNYANTVSFEGYGDPYRIEGHVIAMIGQVYDWCYPLLDDSTKATLIAYAEGIAKSLEVNYPPNGQSSVTSHGSEQSLLHNLLVFSLATYDERPDIYDYCAGRLLDEYIPARNFWSPSHFNIQGTGYGSYRGVWDYWCAWLFKKGTGADVFDGDLQYVPYMWLYLRRPDGMYFRFGDDGADLGKTEGYLTGMSNTLFLAATYYNDPILKKEYARQSPMMGNFNVLFGYYTPINHLIFNDPGLELKNLRELPLSKYFSYPKGMMVARTGWEDGRESDNVIAYMNIGELWSANHEHLEAGSFQLYYKGLLASESGNYGSGYASAHDLSYNKRSIAHNTLAIYDPDEKESYYGTTSNDGGQRVPGGGMEKLTLDDWKSAGYETGTVLDHEFGPDEQYPEYTYIKGDITKAYGSKVSEVLRSMVFLPLEDEDHPAVLIVMDKVTSSNASFKKSFLLHILEEPSISGNTTTVTRTAYGLNNGKMVVETLLPADAKIEKIGGPGKEYWVDGQNFDVGVYDPETSNEGQGWGRIEISPAKANKTDYFLNVMTVGDADSKAADLKSTLIESDTLAGAVVSDRVAVFGKDAKRMEKEVSFTIPGTGEFKVFVSGIKEGTWTTGDGEDVIVTKDGGAAYFTASAGAVKLTYKDSNANRLAMKSPANTNDVIGIRISKAFKYSDVDPIIVDDRTLVPMRVIFEGLGADVTWDQATSTATATKEGHVVTITNGSNIANVAGAEVELDVAATIIDGRFLVPIRFVAESFGARVNWDPFARIVDITPGRIVAKPDGDVEAKDGNAKIDGCKYSSYYNDEIGEYSYDDDVNTLWSTEGKGEWIAYEFDEEYTVTSAYLVLNKASERVNYFELHASADGKTYELIGKFTSDGKSDGELFKFDKPVKAKYIKFVGQGNSVHDWCAIKEIEFRLN